MQKANSDGIDPKHLVIRAVHGHSKSIQDQLRNDMAHALVMEHIPIMAHATYSELLPSIIGLGAPGLLPGGDQSQRHTPRELGVRTSQRPGSR